MENIKREQTPSQIPKPNAFVQIGKTKYSRASIFVQEVPTTTNIIVAKFNAIARANI